jgi:hypothetical protein
MVVTMHVWLILGVGGLAVIAADASLRRSRANAANDARPDAEDVDRDPAHQARDMREPDAVIVTCPQSLATDQHDAPRAVAVRVAVRRRPPTQTMAPRRPPNRAARRDL